MKSFSLVKRQKSNENKNFISQKKWEKHGFFCLSFQTYRGIETCLTTAQKISGFSNAWMYFLTNFPDIAVMHYACLLLTRK